MGCGNAEGLGETGGWNLAGKEAYKWNSEKKLKSVNDNNDTVKYSFVLVFDIFEITWLLEKKI